MNEGKKKTSPSASSARFEHRRNGWTDRLIDRHRQTDRQTQTDRSTDTDRQIDRHRQTNKQGET